MTFEDAKSALLAHFATEWATAQPTVPIQFPNTKHLSIDSETQSWVRIRFFPSFARHIALGCQRREQGGRVLVTTFTPLGEGDGLAATLDRAIEDLWEQAYVAGLPGDIHLNAPDPVPGIEDPDLPMWRSGVAVPFRIDHLPL